MSKYLLLCCLSFLSISFSFSQPLVFDYMPLDKKISGDVNTFFFEDKETKELFITLSTKKKICRFRYVSDNLYYKELIQFPDSQNISKDGFSTLSISNTTVFDIYNKKIFVGAYKNGPVLNEIFFDATESKYIFLETDFSTGKTEIIRFFQLAEKEKMLAVFIRNKNLWVTAFHPKKNELYFYISNATQETIKKTIEIDLNDTLKGNSRIAPAVTLSFREILKSKQLPVLENGKEYPYLINAQSRKLYIYPDHLVFTINSHDFYTHLLSISLDSLTYSLQSFDLTPVSDNKYSQSNHIASALHNQYLVTMHRMAENRVRLNIFNKDSQLLLKTAIFDDQLLKEVATIPVTKVGNFSDDEIKLKTTLPILLSRVDKLSISPAIKNDILYISAGGVYDRTSGDDVVLGLLGAGLSLGLTAALSLLPSTDAFWFLLFSESKNSNLNNTISFQTAFKEPSLELVKAEPQPKILSQLFEFSQSHKHSLKYQQITFFNSSYYLSAVTEDRKRFIMHKF
jgi:hypothetical protein